MHHIEELASPGGWNHRSRSAGGDVTEQCGTRCPKRDVFQLEPCYRCPVGLDTGILLLTGSHGGVIHAFVEGIDGHS